MNTPPKQDSSTVMRRDFHLKNAPKTIWRRGFRPDPLGSLQRSPDPLAGFMDQRTPREGVVKGIEKQMGGKGNGREGKRSEGRREKGEEGKGFHTRMLHFAHIKPWN